MKRFTIFAHTAREARLTFEDQQLAPADYTIVSIERDNTSWNAVANTLSNPVYEFVVTVDKLQPKYTDYMFWIYGQYVADLRHHGGPDTPWWPANLPAYYGGLNVQQWPAALAGYFARCIEKNYKPYLWDNSNFRGSPCRPKE